MAQKSFSSSMPRKYTRCKGNVTYRLRSLARAPDDPKSCTCKIVAETSVEDTNTEKPKTTTVPTFLSPKASKEIVKPEVDDIETAIFLERILSLFGRVMKKLELAAALPIILADPEISKIVTEAEMKIVRRAFNDHRRDTSGCSDRSLTASDGFGNSQQSSSETDMSSESACATEILGSRVYEALEILNSYSGIREKVKTFRKEIVPQFLLFLQHMKYYVEYCVRRMHLTPFQEKLREQYFRKLWHENHKAQQDIDALVNFLEEQRLSHHEIMEAIGFQYRKDCDTVERLNKKCTEDIKTTVNRSERRQIIEYTNSEMRQNDLSQYLVISKNRLENLRETNLRLEQEIRSKRFKVSSQLTGLIGKFDTEVGERYRILEQLIEEFGMEKEKKEMLEEEMKIQLKKCNVFLEEIEQKNLAIFQEKLDTFTRNHAARVIQYWWRPIFKRLKLKKKKIKLKKKKKK